MEIFYITLLTLIAATIGTITGFGTSTLMIPVLVIFFPPVEAIFLVAIIHWFGNIWKIALFRSGFNLRLLALFGVVGLVTSYLGAYISLGANEEVLLRVLGAFLAGYALFVAFQSKFKIPAGNLTALSGGALSGFFAGMFGVGGAIGLLVDSTRIITYFIGGATLPRELWYGLILFIPVSFIGARIAKKVVDRIPQNKFRLVIAVFLLAIGTKLIFWP